VRGTKLLATALIGAASIGRAEPLPWIEPGDVPLPARVSSVEILRRDEPLLSAPDGSSARRGSARQGAHLPLYAARRGPGCTGRWLMVGPIAWVCETVVRLSAEPALAARRAPEQLDDGLPHRYHFVGSEGSLGYKSLRLAEEGIPDAELQPGFALAIQRVANKRPGDAFGLTTHDLWVPMRDLSPARTFLFQGETLNGELDIAWVHTSRAALHASPDGARVDGQVRVQFEALRVLETATRNQRRWFRIGEALWVSDREVRAPTAAAPPPEVRPGERWIDVEIDSQVLTAYEGTRPVFSTLVSTGKGRGKSELATPKGVHRIWVKLRSTDMDNLENADARRYYAIQDVPWVMFFQKGYGLHGTFWHRSFGQVRSHGCVNLSPLDAQRLFHWTSPRLPAGWSATLPTEYERGSIVRVR
jgi:lipoprotein-anchoring transpeptidase ErfK/SrfK